MDNHTKDSKKSPVYQFQLLVTEIENDKALQLKKSLHCVVWFCCCYNVFV
jgi:hypothetical protein